MECTWIEIAAEDSVKTVFACQYSGRSIWALPQVLIAQRRFEYKNRLLFLILLQQGFAGIVIMLPQFTNITSTLRRLIEVPCMHLLFVASASLILM